MYNKNKIQKTNEKKIMKKVKKQWVVASLATFALLGGGTISAVQTGSQQVVAGESVEDTRTDQQKGYDEGIQVAKGEKAKGTELTEGDYETAYNNAKSGYLDGWNYKDKSSENSDYTKAYDNAYNNSPIVQGANAGIEAAKGENSSSQPSGHDSGSVYDASYNTAYKGVIAGKSGNESGIEQTTKDSDIYKKAFEIGQKITADKVLSEENEGIAKGIEAAEADALDGTKTYSIDDRAQTSRLLPTNGSQIYKDAYQKAYDAVVLGTNNSNFDLDSKYEQAYNRGKSIRAKQKTALVSNSKQLHDAIKSEDVTNIKAVKDISMWSSKASGTIKTFDNGNEQQFSKPLSIDGGGHTIDFAGSRYAQSIASDITLKNMVMYGTEYYGTVRTNAASNITYDNFRYYGPQLVESTNARITIKNKVEATSTKQQYKPSDIVTDAEDVKNLNSDLTVDLKTSEEMIKGSTVTFEKGSQFDGYTNNGQVIFITNSPKVNVEEEARVSLHPRGNKVGLYMGSGEFNVKKNATFSIYPEKDINSNKLSNSLYMSSGGTLTVDGGQFNVKMDGDLYSSNPINIGGDVVVQNNGKFIVEKTGGGSQTASLVNVTGRLTVKDKSSLGIAASGLGNYTLLKTSGNVDIQNPSNTSFDLNGNNVSGVVFDLRGNTNSSSKYIDGKDVKLQAITINDIPYANVTIPNGYPKNGILKGTNVESTTDGDKEPSDNKDNKYLQFKAVPNFKIESTRLISSEETKKIEVVVNFMDSYGEFKNINYPLYLGIFDKNNKTAINNGSVSNEKFQLNAEKAYKYNSSEQQNKDTATFSIDVGNSFDESKLKNFTIRGQYIVGDDTRELGVSPEDIKNASEGAQDYINNGKSTQSRYVDSSPYKTGYDKAEQGYQAGIGGNNPLDDSNFSQSYERDSYYKGFNKGQADKTASQVGYDDAIKGQNKRDDQETSVQSSYDKGHAHGEKIVQAIKDVLATPPNKTRDYQEYEDAYDAALKVLRNSGEVPSTESDSYKAGRENAQGLKDALNENPNTVAPNKDGVSVGYKLTAQGMQDAKNNTETSEFSNSVFYQAGKAEYQNGKQAFLDGKADPKEDSTKTKAFKQAYADALDGYNQFDTNKNIDLSGKSQAFKDGYKTAQAVNDYLEGNEKQDSGNPAYNNAYQDANNGASAVSNQTSISEAELKSKSQAFQKAYNATKKQTEGASDFAKDSTKEMDSKKSEDLNYKAGFKGARDGQTDGAKDGYNGKVKTESELKDEGKTQTYIKSYSGTSQAASLARQGAIEAVNENGQGEPEKAEDAYKSGYDGAKQALKPLGVSNSNEANYQTGFNLAKGISDRLANKANAVTREPTNAYESGVKSVDDGQKDYHLSKSKDTDRYRNDKAYQIGYDKAESAVKDFLAGESAKDNNDGIYKDAYNKAAAGYNDVNKADDDSSVRQGNLSQAYKEARQVSKDQQAGADKYLADTTSISDGSQDSKAGFDGAKDGQQDGAAGITKSENEANKSKAYKDAYSKANQLAKEARDGAQAAINGDSSKYNQQGAEKPTEAYKKGYEGAQKGLAKDTSDVSKDANTQTGYNLGKGTQDALNSGVQATTGATDKGYKTAYDAVKAGAKSYQAGNATDSDNENTKNQYSNNASYKKGYDTAKQAVTDFTEGRTAQSNDALYREIYQNTVDGYNNASRNESDKKADYKTGQESKNQGAAGSDAYQKQTDKEIKGKFYEDGYAGAKQATEDGLAKKAAKTDFSDLTLAYKDAYETAYPKAVEARKGAEAALENPNQTPNGGDDFNSGFNGAKAGFKGDQKANAANAQYVAAYDRAQGIKDALANPTVKLAASDTHSESYKAGYRDAQTGIAASLNKESKAADTDQAYSKGYDAVEQGVKDYQDGVTPMPTGKTKAYEKGYTEAQAGHDDALKSGLNKEEDLSGQSKQYQDSYKATKAALYGQKDYLSSRTQTNKNKYPDYQASYNEGFEGAKAGQSNGLSGASSNTKGKSAAYKVGYKFGYDSGYSSYLSNLGSGQLSGQNDGENGLPLADLSMYGGTYSSSYMAAYKQAYDNYQNGVAQADEDLTNGVKVDLSGKSKAYINGYNSISANMAQTTVSHIANEGVLIWDMVDGKPVQTTSYEHHQNSVRATKETKVVDGISYTKLANNRGWLQTKYLADPSSKAGVVNYISGYGVLVWNSGQNTMKSSETTELSLANVKTYDEKVIDGISYTRINAKDSDQWVQTQYLKPATPTPTSGVASVGNVPANHAIYLRDKDGNMTDQAIFADTSWKVFSQKRISGELYYCLGNDNQWIEAKYVTEFK